MYICIFSDKCPNSIYININLSIIFLTSRVHLAGQTRPAVVIPPAELSFTRRLSTLSRTCLPPTPPVHSPTDSSSDPPSLPPRIVAYGTGSYLCFPGRHQRRSSLIKQLKHARPTSAHPLARPKVRPPIRPPARPLACSFTRPLAHPLARPTLPRNVSSDVSFDRCP